jgi:predicted dehydrogenase
MLPKIGVAVVGCGRIGFSHMDAVVKNSNKAFLAAVVDVDEARAKKAAQDFSTQYYTSLDKALGDSKVDAVVVCLPNNEHYPIATKAMKIGKHVLVEKPFAMNPFEAIKMIDYSRKNGLVLMAGMSFRHISAVTELKKRLNSDIGEPFNFIYMFLMPGGDVKSVPPWWTDNSKTGGFQLALGGSHTIDMTLWFFEHKKAVSIYAQAQAQEGFEGYSEITLMMMFDDGAMATNHLSSNTKPPKHEILVVGPKGSASLFPELKNNLGLVGVPTTDLFINGELIMSGCPERHNFAIQMEEFINAISEKREPWVKLDQIITSLTIIEAAKKSIELGKPIAL